MQPSNRNVVFLSTFAPASAFINALLQYYGEQSFVKLNDIQADESLPNLLTSGGADDTLLSGSVVKIDGEWWLDDGAYASIGIGTLQGAGKTYVIAMAPNANDLSTTEAYLFELRSTTPDRLFPRFTTTAQQFSWVYLGNGVSEVLSQSDDWIANKDYLMSLAVGTATNPISMFRDGLILATTTVANDWAATTLSSTRKVIGAADTSGTSPFNGKKGELAIYNGILTTAQIRADAKHYHGKTRFGHTNLYGVKGDGSSAYLTVNSNASIDNHFDGGKVLAFEGVAHSYTSLDRILNKRTSAGWTVYQSGSSGNLFGIAFLVDFSVSDGAWIADPIIELDKPFIYIVEYDASSDANKPTVTIIQNGIIQTLTVGSGLTESITPSGTRIGDSSLDMGILAIQTGANHADATAHQAALLPSGVIITELGQDWSGHNPVAYWKFGDYVDSSGNVDNIDTNGNGIILDASQTIQLGNEMWDANASTFEGSSVYGWNANGNNTVTNTSNYLDVTYVDTSVGASVFLRDSEDLNADVEIGKVYRLTADVKVNTGSVTFRVHNGTATEQQITVDWTDFRTVELYVAPKSTTVAFVNFYNMGAGQIASIDNISFKEVQGTPALPVNMDNGNMTFLPSRRVETYRQAMIDLLNPTHVLWGRANGFDHYENIESISDTPDDTNLGTNTANGNYTYLGERLIDFDGSTSYVNLFSIINGAFPTSIVIAGRVNFDNWADGVSTFVSRIIGNGGTEELRIFKSSINTFTFLSEQDGVGVQVIFDVSGFTGIHHFVCVQDGVDIHLYIDGDLKDSNVAAQEHIGNIDSVIAGASSATPLNVLPGQIVELSFKLNATIDASQVSQLYNLLPEIN